MVNLIIYKSDKKFTFNNDKIFTIIAISIIIFIKKFIYVASSTLTLFYSTQPKFT